MNLSKPKRIAVISMLTAMALIVYTIESNIPPPIAVPGVKLGLANAVTLAALYFLRGRDVLLVVVIRLILGNVFAGSPTSFIYSAAGGLAAYFVMFFVKKVTQKKQIWLVSIFGAVANSFFQVVVAACVLKSLSVLYYLIPLSAVSIICGLLTGVIAQNVVMRLNSYSSNHNNEMENRCKNQKNI